MLIANPVESDSNNNPRLITCGCALSLMHVMEQWIVSIEVMMHMIIQLGEGAGGPVA